MTLLPIVVRELRVAARRKSTYRARFWTAFSSVSFGTYLVYVSGAFMGNADGTMIFYSLVVLCFWACLALSANTNDCISEEKREGTLGLLFLTDLKGHDIALGKLFSVSLISFYCLLGVLPIVAMSLLFGGITAVEFWEVALALLNVFFFSQCVGLLVSTFGHKRRTTTFWSAMILLAYTGGFYLLTYNLSAYGFRDWADVFERMNPGYCVYYACNSGYNSSVPMALQFGHYWSSLLLIHLNAWLFLAVASGWLPRCWQEKPSQPKGGWAERLRQWYHARLTPRRQLLDKNAFLWLSVRNRLGSLRVWIVLLALNTVWVWVLCKNRFDDAGPPLFFTAVIVNHLMLKLFVVSEAAGNLDEQRRNGGLEFLLSCTPLSVEEIVAGQWAALRRLLLWPTVAVLLTDIGMLITILIKLGSRDTEGQEDFAMFVLALIAMLFPDLITLGWVGMWKGMSARKPRHAAGAAIFQVLVAPWLFLILITTLVNNGGGGFPGSFGGALVFWFVVGALVDAISCAVSSEKLVKEFRARAAVQGGETIGLMGRLGRMLGQVNRSKPPRI